jgi:hypothetical protein
VGGCSLENSRSVNKPCSLALPTRFFVVFEVVVGSKHSRTRVANCTAPRHQPGTNAAVPTSITTSDRMCLARSRADIKGGDVGSRSAALSAVEGGGGFQASQFTHSYFVKREPGGLVNFARQHGNCDDGREHHHAALSLSGHAHVVKPLFPRHLCALRGRGGTHSGLARWSGAHNLLHVWNQTTLGVAS